MPRRPDSPRSAPRVCHVPAVAGGAPLSTRASPLFGFQTRAAATAVVRPPRQAPAPRRARPSILHISSPPPRRHRRRRPSLRTSWRASTPSAHRSHPFLPVPSAPPPLRLPTASPSPLPLSLVPLPFALPLLNLAILNLAILPPPRPPLLLRTVASITPTPADRAPRRASHWAMRSMPATPRRSVCSAALTAIRG